MEVEVEKHVEVNEGAEVKNDVWNQPVRTFHPVLRL